MAKKKNYEDTLRSIGLRMQLFRKQKDITQEELAAKINKSKDTISNIERGLAFARIETLIDICNELAIELKDLFEMPIVNNVNAKKSACIKEILNVLAAADDSKVEKYLEVLKLMA